MSQRSSPHAPAASASTFSSSAVASSASSLPSNEEQQMETIPDPCPIRRLHRHALESILGFCAVGGLAAAIRVSKEWSAAVSTMRSVRFTFPAPSAADLLPVLHSPLVRHLGVIDVRWAGSNPWSVSPAIMAQLSARLTQLSDLSCADDRLEPGQTAASRLLLRRMRVDVRLSVGGQYEHPSMEQLVDLLTTLVQLSCVVGLQPFAGSWLSPVSTVRYWSGWGQYRPDHDSDVDQAKDAHALVTQLCVCCPTLESLSTEMMTALADLRTISERLPQLHTLRLRLPSDELMQHITVATSAQRQAALLEGLDAVDMIPDLAALCAEFVEADPAADACLTVAFLPQQIRDVGLLIRQTEYDDDNQAFLQLTTAVVRSLQTLPQLTALKLDLMPWEGYSEEPVNYLAGFDWGLLGELTALTSLSLWSTGSDPDYSVVLAWDEAAAISALRKLTLLTALDVSGFARPTPPPRLFDEHADGEADDDDEREIEDERSSAFDIVSFAWLPVAHPSLRHLRGMCGWGIGGIVVLSADQCAAFRRLPALQLIGNETVEQALDSTAKIKQWKQLRDSWGRDIG